MSSYLSALQVNHIRGHPLGEIAVVLDKEQGRLEFQYHLFNLFPTRKIR